MCDHHYRCFTAGGHRGRRHTTVDFTALVITGALLSVVPLAAFLLAMQRFWRSGVSLGALKS